MKLRCFLTALIVIVHCCAFSQGSTYQFLHLDIGNGLSDNQVNCIFKDAKGFMWFGTASGLDRYDGYSFKVFKYDPRNPNSISKDFVHRIFEGPDNSIWIKFYCGFSVFNPATEGFSNNIHNELSKYKVFSHDIKFIRKDQNGNFWFLTVNEGVYCYHPSTKTTTFYNHSSRTEGVLHSNSVTDIINGGDDYVWLINGDGIIEKLNYRTNQVVQQVTGLAAVTAEPYTDFRITLTNDSNLWIWANGAPKGVYMYNTQNRLLGNFSKEQKDAKLNSNVIQTVIEGDDGNIWVGTDHGGINLINKINYKVTYLLNREDDPKSLRGNSQVLYKDNEGIIWAGSNKQGVNYYHKDVFQFPLKKHYPLNKYSLPFEDVNAFAEDKNGNLWIGTNGGGLIYYDYKTGRYKQFSHQVYSNSLSNDIITSLYIDKQDKLWIGTYFGGLDCLNGEQFIHYRHSDKNKATLTDDRVYSIAEDASNKLWVGTFTGGVNILDTKTGIFSHPVSGYKELNSSYISVVYKDRQNNMWIGSLLGAYVIDHKTGEIKHFQHRADDPYSLSGNDVNDIVQDSRGLFWLSTKRGLSVLNLQHNKFHNFNSSSGLSNNSICRILEDDSSRMWISKANGLSRVTITKYQGRYTYKVVNYNESDGLQGQEFNFNAALKTQNGNLIFGGAQGYNYFDPLTIHPALMGSVLNFTDFQLFNKSVTVGDTVNGSVVLTKSITQTKTMVLNHDQNVFSIEFADCNFFSPNKIQYQFMLSGFDKSWLTVQQGTRKATYTNLDAGDYVFKVKSTDANNRSNEVAIAIKILPPFWKSTLAYFIYIISASVLLFYIRYRGILKLKREFSIKQQQIEAERRIIQLHNEAKHTHELDLLKIKFFTNVSHEFRTPLSLILAPIDKIIGQTDNTDHKQQLQLINRNAKRLLNLVNQLLDFRKVESHELKLNLENGDIIAAIKDIVISFTDIAESKNIDFTFDSETDELAARFDHDKLERILFNLLSNAFKFTPKNGYVSVLVSVQNVKKGENTILKIKVMDTGIGVPADKYEKIFNRFFQNDVPEFMINQGSGIGLAITKEFVKLHNGEIYVESEEGRGSCFTVKLPIQPVNEQYAPSKVEKHPEKAIPIPLNEQKTSKVLIVEDNEDFRLYLKDNLSRHFKIIEAANGKEGWQKALAFHPDLIVSDINMPEMNGIDLCLKLKNDKRTTHIPVILLTVLTGEDAQLHGLQTGATDYITKPFNCQILISKVKNILSQQELTRATFTKQVEINPSKIEIESPDEEFIQKALQIIDLNIENADFSVEKFSSEMCMSRVTLYKKALELTGASPVELIRNVRLKRAAQLLEQGYLTVYQVCYKVGFKNLKYFNRIFKSKYNTTPSAYQSQKNVNTVNVANEVEAMADEK